MSAEISCHDTVSTAMDASRGSSEWLELAFTDSTGQSFEITAFFARKGDAQVYADAINQAFAVVEPPAVSEIETEAA